MQTQETETFCPASRDEWRQWLKENHDSKQSVWLVCYKKGSGMPTLSWAEAVEEALCFGWVDSIRKPVDHEKFIQFFSRRKPKSVWSKINKESIQRLTEKGLMAQAGRESVETAKLNGSWTILDEVEELIIPDGLEEAFKTNPGSKEFFLSLSKSVKKRMLQWIVLAKLPETKNVRINEIAELAAQKLKPKQF